MPDYSNPYSEKHIEISEPMIYAFIIGAVWARIINDYGHIDDETSEKAVGFVHAQVYECIHSELGLNILAIRCKKDISNGFDVVNF